MRKTRLALSLVPLIMGVAGCGTVSAAGTSAPAPSATAPAAASSPAGAAPPAATVTGTCVTGLYNVNTGAFVPEGQLVGDATVSDAYQLTLTNTSSTTTADVTGFAVTLIKTGGVTAGSDQESVSSTLIPPQRSHTWVEHPWGRFQPSAEQADPGPYGAGTTGAVDEGTCVLEQWYLPGNKPGITPPGAR